MEDMQWLEGQTITIPVEVFIKMSIKIAEIEQRNSDLCREKYALKDELEEAHKSVADYKKQLMEVLGVDRECC